MIWPKLKGGVGVTRFGSSSGYSPGVSIPKFVILISDLLNVGVLYRVQVEQTQLGSNAVVIDIELEGGLNEIDS
jgi:hypothetical protein